MKTSSSTKALESIRGRRVVDTDLCQVILDAETKMHRIFVLAESKQWLELKELPGDLKGLVNGLDLAMAIVSGKFWVKGLYSAPSEAVEAPRALEYRAATLVTKGGDND